MSKPICLVFALLILTTILCNNSVCSRRGFLKQSAVCGCRIRHHKSLQCTKTHSPKTTKEYHKMIECICRNRQKYFNEASKKQFINMCISNSQTPL
ncbi:uncharacterized protein LOC143736544 [Siphateles boraxobius]|uniref:uncharacterized protein LOC143736544 n=1 Tax=Siphateles boraxobius TaxID=180520 RepID=UPI004063BDE4